MPGSTDKGTKLWRASQQLSFRAVATEAWNTLSFSHRKEHARAITEAKADDTRARRVAKTIATLRGEV